VKSKTLRRIWRQTFLGHGQSYRAWLRAVCRGQGEFGPAAAIVMVRKDMLGASS
jgi:hypothetical protein